MAMMRIHRGGRNAAWTIGQVISGSWSAAAPVVLLHSPLSSSPEALWRRLHESGRECDSGNFTLSEFHSRYAQLLVQPQFKRDANLRFSQQFSTVSPRISSFGKRISDLDTGGSRTIPLDFREHVGHNFRLFGTTSWAERIEEGTGEETLAGAPTKSVRRPLGRSSQASSKVRQLKERCFDDIIENEKKLKVILSIKDLLGAGPNRFMSVLVLGKSKERIGFKGNGRVIAYLKRYPGVFRVHETAEIGKVPWFQFTPEAEAAIEEEMEVRGRMNDEVVTKLRKLLMMSSDRTLPLSKIAHLGRDLGLPDDFRKNLVYEYPRYFRVVRSKDPMNAEGPNLELVRWSTRLAVTEAEKKAQEQMQQFGHDSLPKLDSKIHKRYRLSNKDKHVVKEFDEVDCPSPYEDASHLHPRSVQFEKREVLFVQELLSLCLEKRVLVDHLTHFRKEFNFSNKVHAMLLRHPEHFYVSRKGSRDTVFLRGAFKEIHVLEERQRYGLIEKHPLVLVKEKLAALMEVKSMAFSAKTSEDFFQGRDVPVDNRTIPAQGRATSKIDPW